VGIDAWRQMTRVKTREETEGGSTQDTEKEKHKKARQGWTMAAALIWYQLRKQKGSRAQQDTTGRGQAHTDESGKGVVIFDLETTHLIEDSVELAEMEISIACAARIPTARSSQEAWAQAEKGTFWHEHARQKGNTDGGIGTLLEWFDDAKLIVAYNGRAFDMEVLKRYYGEDAAGKQRWNAHIRKLQDPFIEARRIAGRRVKLSSLLAHNGRKGKAGAGCDAPGLWRAGKLEQLERYCQRDVDALAELVLQEEMRVPGGATTKEASIRHALQQQEMDSEDDAEEVDTELSIRHALQQQEMDSEDDAEEVDTERTTHKAQTGGKHVRLESMEGWEGAHAAQNEQAERKKKSRTQGTAGKAAIATNVAGSSAQHAYAQHTSKAAAQRKRSVEEEEVEVLPNACKIRPNVEVEIRPNACNTYTTRQSGIQTETQGATGKEAMATNVAGSSAQHASAAAAQRKDSKRERSEQGKEVPPPKRPNACKACTTRQPEPQTETNLATDRERRKRKHTSYDEIKRRKRRCTPKTGYMEKGRNKRTVTTRDAIVVGSRTLDRIVGGRYDWRNGDLRPWKRQRNTWYGNRTWDPGQR
jgi:hypothetical protein